MSAKPEVRFHTIPATGREGLRPKRLRRWLALNRGDDYWIGPCWGAAGDPLPARTLCVFWEETGGRCGCAVALTDGDLSAWLEGDWNLRATGCLPGTEPKQATLLATAQGDDPYQLAQRVMAAAAAHLGTFRLREQKAVPAFIDRLGWCTWDAFYHEVDHRKVVAGLAAFQRAGLPVRFLILDDGWLDFEPRDWLKSFRANPLKFPKGLSGLVRETKERFGIQHFGVWHAFQGYWGGLAKDGELARRYRTITNRGVLRKWEKGPPEMDLRLVHPDEAHRFFADWYAELARAGVDLVKTDGQNATTIFTQGQFGQVSAFRAHQQAQQAAAVMRFGGQTINCMCNSLEVALGLSGTNVWRNSVDYFPKRPPRAQQWHITANALNALWTSTFAIPDWDGFQSTQTEAHFHAVARAISGGPIYFNDRPGETDPALVRRLIAEDGRVLRCPTPGMAARRCMFTDVNRQAQLLTVINHAGGIGIAAAFHCRFRDSDAPAAAITDHVSPTDLIGVPGSRFACLRPSTGELRLLPRRGRFPLTLSEMQADAVVMSPIVRGIAPFGLLDKLCPPAVIEGHGWLDDRHWHLRVWEGGHLGIYCARRPKACAVNGRKTRFAWDRSSGLLTIRTPAGATGILLTTG